MLYNSLDGNITIVVTLVKPLLRNATITVADAATNQLVNKQSHASLNLLYGGQVF